MVALNNWKKEMYRFAVDMSYQTRNTANVLFYLGIVMEDVFVAAVMREETCETTAMMS